MSSKGKYLLGIVDSLMCDKYRDRVFKDVGKSDLKSRCLEIPTHPNCEQHLVCSKVSKIETKVVLKLTAKSVTFTFFGIKLARCDRKRWKTTKAKGDQLEPSF